MNKGLYEWDDGEQLNYTNFINSNPIQTCVYQYNNQWFDSECFVSKRVHVCKQPKSKMTYSSILIKTYSYCHQKVQQVQHLPKSQLQPLNLQLIYNHAQLDG